MLRYLILLATLSVSIGCGDDIHKPCGEYTPTWEGVKCFMNVNCISCHSERHDQPAVRTVLPDAVLLDVENKIKYLVVPEDPDASTLWRVVSGELDPQRDYFGIMPQGYAAPLPPDEIKHIRQWIENGAKISEGGAP